MNNAQLEKKYADLMHDVANDVYYKVDLTNRVNCYVCECGHITKTKDVDPGVTPFMFNCEKCGGMAKSRFYTDIAPEKKPTIEWYRPTLEQVKKMHRKKDFGTIDHILNGCLVNRAISRN